MSSVTFADHPWLVPDRPRRSNLDPFRKGCRVAALAYVALLGVVVLDTRPAIGPGCSKTPVGLAALSSATITQPEITPNAAPPAVQRDASPLFDPKPAGDLHTFADATPLPAAFQFTPVVVADVEQDDDGAIPEPPVVSPLLAEVPMPMPRPADLTPRPAEPAPPARLASLTPAPAARPPFRPTSRPTVGAGQEAADNRTFFEKVFGVQPSSGPALAYAAPEDGFFGSMRRAVGGGNPTASYGAGTAVYEIAAHTVYMPDGTRLEAHSGLRERLDDPRFVHERMRGPTPPSTYDLKPRETLFHGVQALRLTPTSGSVFGRTGLLAHTYMLGPNGDSNGCVSFRNYKAFLQAYMNGEVRRLVVVARLL